MAPRLFFNDVLLNFPGPSDGVAPKDVIVKPGELVHGVRWSSGSNLIIYKHLSDNRHLVEPRNSDDGRSLSDGVHSSQNAFTSRSTMSGYSLGSAEKPAKNTWLRTASSRSSKICEDGAWESGVLQDSLLVDFEDRRLRISVAVRVGPLEDYYEVLEELGRGSFGIVAKASDLKTGEVFAVKSLMIRTETDKKYLEAELAIARRVSHPNIVRLHEALRDNTSEMPRCHLVMILCDGGTLHDKVGHYSAQRRDSLDEAMKGTVQPSEMQTAGLPTTLCAAYAWQMLSGVAYLHHHSYAHRDIKAENYLLETQAEDASLRLVDFGLSKNFAAARRMTSRVGTPFTTAPEVFEGSYDEKCDVWSVGIVCFMLFLGAPPWLGATPEETERMVKTMDVSWDGDGWKWHPPPALKLVQELLIRDPLIRPAAKDMVFFNKWLRGESGQAKAHLTTESCCTIA
mmetsp:Transcript_36109/g.93256  ORF Transcript_36109/g.93256 Transcript_36109/m.93256 type:complete len:455 (-) Transcript_36109:88-1452(-)